MASRTTRCSVVANSIFSICRFTQVCMIFMAGYMQNFGSQADSQQMSTSWESQYQLLKGSADMEEARKKYTSFSGRTLIGTPRAA